jgi:hypothetical protein
VAKDLSQEPVPRTCPKNLSREPVPSVPVRDTVLWTSPAMGGMQQAVCRDRAWASAGPLNLLLMLIKCCDWRGRRVPLWSPRFTSRGGEGDVTGAAWRRHRTSQEGSRGKASSLPPFRCSTSFSDRDAARVALECRPAYLTPVWLWFRSPHHSGRANVMRTSEPKPRSKDKLLVSFDSEVRKRGRRRMMRTSESGH